MSTPVVSQILQSETYESNVKVVARAIAPHSVCELVEFNTLKGFTNNVQGK
jgi:hypothetical protein